MNVTVVTGPYAAVQYGLIMLMCGSRKMEFSHDGKLIGRNTELQTVWLLKNRNRTIWRFSADPYYCVSISFSSVHRNKSWKRDRMQTPNLEIQNSYNAVWHWAMPHGISVHHRSPKLLMINHQTNIQTGPTSDEAISCFQVSVCLSVHLSQASVLSKQLNVSSCKQRLMVARVSRWTCW